MKMKSVYGRAATFIMALVMLCGCGATGGGSGGGGGNTSATAAAETTAAKETTAEQTKAAEPAKTEAAEQAQASGELPYVEMSAYTNLGSGLDIQMVVDEVNKYFKETINVKLNFVNLDDNGVQRLNVQMAAGEDCGLVGFGGSNYVRHAGLGYYYPLDDLLDKHAPDVKKLFPAKIWDSMRIGGKIYGIPTKKDNCYIIPMMYNVDMADELGIDMQSIKFKSPMQMEQLMVDGKKKRDELHPEWAKYPFLDVMALESPGFFAIETFLGWLNFIAVCNIDGVMDIKGYDAKTIFNLYETPEYLELCKFMQRMTEQNIFIYDRDNNTEQMNNFVEEGVLLGQHTWGLVWISEHFMSNNYKSDILLPEMVWTDTGNFQGIGWSISAKAADPERAMMALNMFNTDSHLATLIRFGIEGEHYLRDSNGKMVLEGSPRNSDPANYGFVNWYGPWLGNLLIVETPESFGGPDNIVLKRIDAYNNSALIPSHMGFVLDQEPIQNELSACDNVINEYGKILREGMIESEQLVDETVKAFIEKLRVNGSEKIIAEVQRQADAFLK